MDRTLVVLEYVFLGSSTVFITIQAFQFSWIIGCFYLGFVFSVSARMIKLRAVEIAMVFSSPLALFNAFFYLTILLSKITNAQSYVSTLTTSVRPIFTVPASADVGAPLIPNIKDVNAADAQSVCPGYIGSNVQRTPLGLTATLILAGTPCNVYGTDIESLNLTVEYQSADRLNINIVPTYIGSANLTQYILSDHLVHKPTADSDAQPSSLTNDLAFFWSNEPTFSFSVLRLSTGDTLFSTAGTNLVFENQFVEFVSPLPANYNLYGLGEVIHGLRLGNNLTRTLYAADAGDPIDGNIYGSHPVYYDTRYYEVNASSGNLTLLTSTETQPSSEYVSFTHGVYNRNAHGQEILLRPSNITWRQIGGSIDLYFYSGPSQADVTKAYQKSAIGLPVMQQYFTFGYHQCRWGYQNWTVLQEVVDAYAKFEIPLETIWTDIDYMNQYRDFSVDPNAFSYEEGKKFLAGLHANGQHYVPIVDSAIYIPNANNDTDAYPTFDRGNATGSFLKNPDGSLYIGEVWPGYTVFPDWLSDGAGKWWSEEMKIWHESISFSGIWIDMSEVSSFCVGSCGSSNVSLNPVHTPFQLPGEPGNAIFEYPEGFNLTNATEATAAAEASASQSAASAATAGPTSSTVPVYLRTTPTPGVRDVNYPPYTINNVQGDLAVHAVSPNATHADGTLEYDVHNLFGHQILVATYNALLNIFPGKRPFIIGRSNFAGSGSVAGHWGGDNASKWYYMYFGIPQALSFSLFGIPMFGVDTCGFGGNSDEELCNRWMQLSAFFPFYRNHNVISANAQEAYVWSSVIDATKKAMNIRFELLPYIYTLFYLANTSGSTVMRALAWEFPNEPSLANADRQFFLGPAILVTPVLTQGSSSVNGVFPGAGKGEVYYDWYTQSAVDAKAGENKTIDAPLGHIPVYIRGGYVIPSQSPAMSTREARRTPWSVLVALNLEGSAQGSLYLDDGESINPNATLYVNLAASGNSLYASGRGCYQDTNNLTSITILGVQNSISNVSVNGVAISSGVNYNSSTKVLSITQLDGVISGGVWAADWTLTWS